MGLEPKSLHELSLGSGRGRGPDNDVAHELEPAVFESIPVVRLELSKDISLYQVGRTGYFSNMTAVRTSEGVVVFADQVT
jgi:hypothetical protein